MRLPGLALCASLLLASGCIYRIDVQQGNVVVAEQLARVKPGMSRNEVKQVLGTPLLADAFHANRWDYWFYNAKRGSEVERHRVTVVFDKDVVARVEGQAPAAIKGEAPPAARSAGKGEERKK